MFGKPLLIIAFTVMARKCDAAMMMGVPNETASSNVTAMPPIPDPNEQPGWSPPLANDTAAEGDYDEKPAEQPGWWFPHTNDTAAQGDSDNVTSNTDEKPAEQPNDIIESIPVFLDSEQSNPELNNSTTTEMVFYLTKSAGNMSEPNAEMPSNETIMDTTVTPVVTPSMTAGNITTGGLPIIV